jgi:predicted metal-dependent peptidase
MRLNRRQPERFDLPGSVDDKILKIVVAIDTSGSMSDSMIGQVMNELFEILARRKHDITVIECDAEVRRVYKAKSPADVKKKVAGRGGTMFSPVIDYVNKDKHFRDALLIYFTDGYGEREIPRPKTYRNLWVIIDDARHLSLKEPYGAVLTL